MRLLDRYLLRELLVPLSYCLGGFLIFWVSADLISQLSDFSEEKLKARDVALYYLLRLPDFLVLIGPVGLLLALLYAVTNHARHNEITAIRSAGVGLWRLCLPYFGVGLVMSFMLAVVNEGIGPVCGDMAAAIRSKNEPAKTGDDANWVSNLNFRNAREGRYWSIQAYNKETSEMRAPRLIWLLPGNQRRDISAAKALYSDGAWHFYEVQEYFYTNTAGAIPIPSQTNELVLPELSETPAHVKSEIKISSVSDLQAARSVQLTTAEILNYLHLHPRLPDKDYARLHTQLHVRLAMPWTALIVVLVAVPFGAGSGRRNVFVGVASSIFLAFGFFALQRVTMALGVGGHMPPVIAGWGPNVFFAAWGFFLISRVR